MCMVFFLSSGGFPYYLMDTILFSVSMQSKFQQFKVNGGSSAFH